MFSNLVYCLCFSKGYCSNVSCRKYPCLFLYHLKTYQYRLATKNLKNNFIFFIRKSVAANETWLLKMFFNTQKYNVF